MLDAGREEEAGLTGPLRLGPSQRSSRDHERPSPRRDWLLPSAPAPPHPFPGDARCLSSGKDFPQRQCPGRRAPVQAGTCWRNVHLGIMEKRKKNVKNKILGAWGAPWLNICL